MAKVFEDYFTEIQADMVSICLEYVEKRAEKIYIYCSFEDNVIAGDFFYKVNGKIVHNHKLNDARSMWDEEYDVSIARQSAAMEIIIEDIESLIKLCQEYQREMPTQIKLVYDVVKNSVNADYSYDLVYSHKSAMTSDDVFEEWYQSEKSKEQ